MTDVTPLILLTRPLADAEGFAVLLAELGITAEVEISPIVEIVPSEAHVDLTDITGVIFSSRNAVAAVDGYDLPAWCVGEATATAARAKGWRAEAADGDADSLYARVLADAPKGPLLHIRGEVARGDLAGRLTKVGIQTHEVVVYRQEAHSLSKCAKTALMRENPVIAPLFSPRAAAQFASQGPYHAPLHVVVMSEAVRDALGDLPAETVVLAEKKEANAMAEAVAGLLDAG
ncbi:uroporphyrinogen-III synthase [Shimia sagamensis]|uniref:Uroporphyrinogen-III synthase n=1 Tax=Shimia sagamensis TaxID=1566352 RepID=A0ABY1NE45_9RHOB|nr:uroporphyrinogen-III synthase [Shimia sagamensis]SMP06685.1 uroporphyrinogen-III synthase [Shimia sagamensis]